MRIALPILGGLALVGCRFEEGLSIENLAGTVVLPEEAATRTIVIDGNEETVTDVRLIGPVVLGLFPEVTDGLFTYTHPVVGPSFEQGSAGDTYPYGGTTIGDVRFACVQDLTCKIASGRYVDYDAIIDWQARVGQPVTDAFGQEITNGDYLKQICYDVLEAALDDEVQLIQTDDRNGDGEVDGADLDFVQRADGKWEAPFTLWQQEYFENAETGNDFTLWGWMDAPSEQVYSFDTCEPENGFNQTEYNVQFDGGRMARDLLNSPSTFIDTGDWVATEGFVYQSVDDVAEIEIDFQVEAQ